MILKVISRNGVFCHYILFSYIPVMVIFADLEIAVFFSIVILQLQYMYFYFMSRSQENNQIKVK